MNKAGKAGINFEFVGDEYEGMEWDDEGNPITPKENDDADEGVEDTENDDAEDDSPESVGTHDSEDYSHEDREVPGRSTGSSPNKYTAYARQAVEDGDFEASDEEISKVVDLESWNKFRRDCIAKSKSEYERFFHDSVVEDGAPKDEMKYLMQMYGQVNSITEDMVRDEGNEDMRRSIIEQDFLNRGYTEDQAKKRAQRSIDSGDDIEDAIEALESNKSFFGNSISRLREQSRLKKEAYDNEQKKRTDNLKKSIIEGKDSFGGIEIDNVSRKRIWDNIYKCVEDNDGRKINAIQRFMRDDYENAIKLFSFACEVTKFGKDWSGLVKSSSKKEVNKARNEFLELIEGNQSNGGGMHIVGSESAKPRKKTGIALDI